MAEGYRMGVDRAQPGGSGSATIYGTSRTAQLVVCDRHGRLMSSYRVIVAWGTTERAAESMALAITLNLNGSLN